MENHHLENEGLILITRSCFSSKVLFRTSEVMLTCDLIMANDDLWGIRWLLCLGWCAEPRIYILGVCRSPKYISRSPFPRFLWS